MKSLARTVLIAFLLSALVFATYAQDAPEANLSDGCVENYDAEVDYFPSKVTVDYAQNFNVEYFNNYKVVTMLPWLGAEEALEYVLVQCGTPAPEGYDESSIFEVPVNSFVATSTSMLPHLDEQGLLDRLVAVDTTLFTSNEDVLALVESGDVAEIGGGGSGGDINFELLLNLEPELVMAQEFYAGGTTLSQLQEAGIPSVLNADYADTSPLGQAEWGKYIALFFNTEAEANELFDAVEGTYQELTALAADVEDRPRREAGEKPFPRQRRRWIVGARGEGGFEKRFPGRQRRWVEQLVERPSDQELGARLHEAVALDERVPALGESDESTLAVDLDERCSLRHFLHVIPDRRDAPTARRRWIR